MGFEDEAQSVERKRTADRLRDEGREDLADRLDGPDDLDQQPLAAVSMFEASEEGDLAAVTHALDRDIPEWRE